MVAVESHDCRSVGTGVPSLCGKGWRQQWWLQQWRATTAGQWGHGAWPVGTTSPGLRSALASYQLSGDTAVAPSSFGNTPWTEQGRVELPRCAEAVILLVQRECSPHDKTSVPEVVRSITQCRWGGFALGCRIFVKHTNPRVFSGRSFRVYVDARKWHRAISGWVH